MKSIDYSLSKYNNKVYVSASSTNMYHAKRRKKLTNLATLDCNASTPIKQIQKTVVAKDSRCLVRFQHIKSEQVPITFLAS